MQKADDIALALLGRVSLLSVLDQTGQPLPIAMPDVAPPWGEDAAPDRYLSVSIFDNVPRWQSVGGGGKVGQGILQVEVISPRLLGVIQPRAAAQSVMAHFPQGLRLLANTAAVKVSAEPWHGSLIPQDERTTIPVSIPWVGFGRSLIGRDVKRRRVLHHEIGTTAADIVDGLFLAIAIRDRPVIGAEIQDCPQGFLLSLRSGRDRVSHKVRIDAFHCGAAREISKLDLQGVGIALQDAGPNAEPRYEGRGAERLRFLDIFQAWWGGLKGGDKGENDHRASSLKSRMAADPFP